MARLSADEFLLSGMQAGAGGCLLRFRLQANPRAIVVMEAVGSLSFDPYDIAWNGSGLVALDWVGKKIEHASWNGSAPLPTVFTPIFDSTSLSELSSVPGLRLGARAGDFYLRFGDRSVRRIFLDGGTWVAAPYDPFLPANPGQSYEVGSAAVVKSFGPVHVSGVPGTFTIENLETGQSVAQGSIPSGQGSAVLVLPQELSPGDRHRVNGSGPSSVPFTPLVRWGQPSVMTDFDVGHGFVSSGTAVVGSSGLKIGCSVHNVAAVPTSDEMVGAVLWMDVRSANGTDPVQPFGNGQYILSDPVTVPFLATLRANNKSFGVVQSIAVPNTPSLEGAVLLFQFGVSRGVIGITDVFGVALRGSSSGQARSSGRTLTASERAQRHRDAMTWLQSLQSVDPNRIFQRLLRR
jgi:hypothetical protein